MSEIRISSSIAIMLICLLAGLAVSPAFGQTDSFALNDGHGLVYALTRPYLPHPVPPVSFEDSPRLEKLMRAGVIYLSLRDAIALALENNLDIESSPATIPSWRWPTCSAPAPASCCATSPPTFRQGPSSASLNVLAGATPGERGRRGQLQQQQQRRAQRLERPVGRLGHSQHRTVRLRRRAASITPPRSRPPPQFTGTPFLVQQYKNLIYGVQQSSGRAPRFQLGLSSVFGYNQNAHHRPVQSLRHRQPCVDHHPEPAERVRRGRQQARLPQGQKQPESQRSRSSRSR